MSNKILLQPNPLQLIIWIPLARGLFLKSPETFREYFGCHNSFYIFATPRFQAIKLRNLLSFSYVQNMLKDHLFKTSGLQFDNWLFGPKSSQEFRETGPGLSQYQTKDRTPLLWRTSPFLWNNLACVWSTKATTEFRSMQGQDMQIRQRPLQLEEDR